MAIAELAAKVTGRGGLWVAAITGGAGGVAGAPAAAGVGGGGAIALLNFRWLARDVSRATALIGEGGITVGRIGRVGLRQVVTFGALGVLIAQGWAHPVGVGIGLAALPPVLLAQGLLDARKDG